jgi:CRISPR-associated protein Cmr5
MLDQTRANLAWEHITTVKNDKSDKQKTTYGSTVHGLPTLIRSAGLSQALHFVLSRNKPEATLVLDHLSVQLTRVDKNITDYQTLLQVVRKADLGRYLRLTQETLACVNWYKRFVQGVLNVDATDEGTE